MTTSKKDPEQIFDILAPLEDTDYGIVYKARDKGTGELKMLEVITVDDIADYADPRNNRQLADLQRLRCPHLIAVHEAFIKDDQIWLCLEYCEPGSVHDMMAVTEQRLQEEQIQSIMHSVLIALDHLHSRRIRHSDIKGANIWIDILGTGACASSEEAMRKLDLLIHGFIRQQSAKYKLCIPDELILILLRFSPRDVMVKLNGLHNRHLCSGIHRGCTVATPYWMAPEVLRDDKRSTKSDIWSLGITAIELATGKPPHADRAPLQALFLIPKSDPPRLPEANHDDNKWSDGFRDFVAQCLVKDAEQRKSAKELLLHQWIQQSKGSNVLLEWVNNAAIKLEEARSKKIAEESQYDDAEGDDDNDEYDDEMYGTMIVVDSNHGNTNQDGAGDEEDSDHEYDGCTMLMTST